MVKTIDRSALVWHSAQNMFDLVNDIAAYPHFLPWCDAAQVLEQGSDCVVASLDIAKGGLRHRFVTRNRLQHHREIQMELVDGPFSHLTGAWRFTALDQDACKIELSLAFELNSMVAGMALGPILTQAANTLVDAFCKRAKELYG